MQEVCRYAVVHCFTFFHLTWLRRLAFILDIAAWNLLFVLTLYISFLTVVTSVLYHLSIALTLTFLILLNLNLPLPPCFSFSSLFILSSLFSYHSFHPLLQFFLSSLFILSLFSPHPIFPSSYLTILSVFSFHQTVSIRR